MSSKCFFKLDNNSIVSRKLRGLLEINYSFFGPTAIRPLVLTTFGSPGVLLAGYRSRRVVSYYLHEVSQDGSLN